MKCQLPSWQETHTFNWWRVGGKKTKRMWICFLFPCKIVTEFFPTEWTSWTLLLPLHFFLFFFPFQAKVSLLSELQSFLSLPVKTQAAVERKIIPLVFNSFTYLYSQEDISPLFSTVRMMRIFIMQHHLKSLLNVLHQKDEVNENWKSCCIHRR